MVKCFVVGCSTGYKSNKGNDAKVFKPPKEEKQFVLWCKKMERSDRKFSRKDHVCSRHFKEEFIIKKSVNGGCLLSRWRLRDDALPTLFLGYKDGIASSKKCRKQTISQLSSNPCPKQPEENNAVRTTSDRSSVELTLGRENSLERTTPETENLVITPSEDDIITVPQLEENNVVQTFEIIEEKNFILEHSEMFPNIPAEDREENLDLKNTTAKSLQQPNSDNNNIHGKPAADTAVVTAIDLDSSSDTIVETIENIICDPSSSKLPPSWRWLPDCDVYNEDDPTAFKKIAVRFGQVNNTTTILKSISVVGAEVVYSVKGLAIPCPKFLSSNFGKLDDITNLVTIFDSASICNGFYLAAEGNFQKLAKTCVKENTNFRSRFCLRILRGKGNMCYLCEHLQNTHLKYSSRQTAIERISARKKKTAKKSKVIKQKIKRQELVVKVRY